MNKRTIQLIGIGIVVLIILSMFSSYNGLVNKDEDVNKAWGNVQNAYQRRADLIPNLVKTVEGAANFERKTLQDVTEARAKATSINIDPTNLTADQLKQFQNAQSGLSSALGRLLVTVERYPDLKATESFKELQKQLEGTENRIRTERNRFNEIVTVYNKAVRRFPTFLYAGLLGFDRRAQFEADSGAQDAPDVDFNFN